MKTLDQITEDLLSQEAIGQRIELTFHRGIDVIYDTKTGTIRLKPVKGPIFGMQPEKIIAKLDGFRRDGDRRYGRLHFENQGYFLNLNSEDIADYLFIK